MESHRPRQRGLSCGARRRAARLCGKLRKERPQPQASGTLTAPFSGIHGWYWQNQDRCRRDRHPRQRRLFQALARISRGTAGQEQNVPVTISGRTTLKRRMYSARVFLFLAVLVVVSDVSAQSLPLAVPSGSRDRTDVMGAIGDSMKLLLIEHGTRIAFQEKTRRELGGPFWSDYQASVRRPAHGGTPMAGWSITSATPSTARRPASSGSITVPPPTAPPLERITGCRVRTRQRSPPFTVFSSRLAL